MKRLYRSALSAVSSSLLKNLRFVSGHRFSGAVSGPLSVAPLGAALGIWTFSANCERDMKALFTISVIFLAVGNPFQQVESNSPGPAQLEWQKVDQLCGQLELTKPTNKTIIVNGKREGRPYETYLNDAEVLLHRGTSSDTHCCGSGKPLAHTRSKRFGTFELPGFEHDCIG